MNQSYKADLIPPGDYRTVIEHAEVKQTSKGDGYCIYLVLCILDGQYKGRKIVDQPDIQNRSKKCVEIGLSRLQKLCKAIGVTTLKDTEQLLDKSCLAHVSIKDGHNYVTGYSAFTPAAATGVSQIPTQSHNMPPQQQSDNKDWQIIQPFTEPDLPTFPIETLSVLSQFVKELSWQLQVSTGMVALLVLAAVSSTIARLVRIEPRTGWIEPTNLYVTAIAEPGTRKSGTHAAVLEPIVAIERERVEAAKPDVARKQSERRQAEKRLEKLEKLAADKGDAKTKMEASQLAVELAAYPPPVLPRLTCSDTTQEATCELLASQGGKILLESTEGGPFSLMSGRYSKNGESQFDVYLKGHSADSITVDRISRPPSSIESPAITFMLTVQPDVIRKAAENESFRGRGLWARFLYDCMPSRVGQRKIATPPVSNEAQSAYTSIIRQLAGTTDELTLRLDGDATNVFLQWETEIEQMLAPGGPMETIRDWGSKLAGATLRIAAVLHCAQYKLFPMVNRQTIESAIKIARYLIPHADYVLNILASQAGSITSDAEWVLRRMRRERRTQFTKRDVHRSGGRRFVNVEAVEPALDELQRRGFIRALDGVKREQGRPSSPQFEVNPAAFSISRFPIKH